MAIDSSTLAWKIPRTEEPGGLQSMGSQRVRHDWACMQYGLPSQTVNFPREQTMSAWLALNPRAPCLVWPVISMESSIHLITGCLGLSLSMWLWLIPTLPGMSFPQQFNEGAGDDGLQGPRLLLPLTLKAVFGHVEINAAHGLMVSAGQAAGTPLPPAPLVINNYLPKC